MALERTIALQHAAAAESGWAPRDVQEARLREIDALLACRALEDDSIDLAIERAVLLGALNRLEEAKLAFISILKQFPTHFSALNEFGALLARTGAIAAACRVYSEAIIHHANNPIAHVNLANLLLRATQYQEARHHYEVALRLEPDNPQAHQGMGAVLADLGEDTAARAHFNKGFKGHAIATLPYRGAKPPIRVLQLVSSGGGNIPTGLFLDDKVYQTTFIVADYLKDLASLPSHDLIVNAIGDADRCKRALNAALRIVKRSKQPVINQPRAVMPTGRASNSQRLRGLPGVVPALTVLVKRDLLAGTNGPSAVAQRSFRFPLLLRSPGYHTGRNFLFVPSVDDLFTAANSLPGKELLLIEFLDSRGRDGKARKFRVMMIDGRLYPLHLAISQNWKVHYFTSDMAGSIDLRREERAFLENMPAFIGNKAMAALEAIQNRMQLDYCGVDFGLNENGDLLLFEANATMVVTRPDDNEIWDYRRAAVEQIIEAVDNLLRRKASRQVC